MDKRNFGERIRAMREARGWPQEQLAELSDVNVRTIQRIEAGAPTSLRTLTALAAAFDVDVATFTAPKKREPGAPEQPNLVVLKRVGTGNDLFGLIGGAHAGHFAHGTLEGNEHVALVADFLQEVHDTGELWNEIGPGQQVRMTHEITGSIGGLEAAGLSVFASAYASRMQVAKDKPPLVFRVSVVYITPASDPRIVKLEAGESLPIMVNHPGL